jgi:hypothetical protein
MINPKNILRKKVICFFAIASFFWIQASAMDDLFDKNQKENIEKPLSIDRFKKLSVTLVPTSANTFPIVFDQLDNLLIVNYQLDGNNVAQCIRLNNAMHFESKDANKYDFLLQSILKTEVLTVDTQGSFTFQKPVETQTAFLKCKSAKFLDKFLSEKSLTLDANCCNNSGDLTCTDILFKGDQFNAMRGSKLNINGTAALLPVNGMFNYGMISCANDALIKTASLENRGTLKVESLHFDGRKVLNEGSVNIGDSFLGKCEIFDHRGKMDVCNDCIFEKIDKFSTTRSSSWKVGGDWKGHIEHLNLEGNSAVGNSAILSIASHAILSGPFHTPILYIDSGDLITCNYTAQLIAMHYVGLKAKGWMQFEGDIFKTFVQANAPANPSQKLDALLKVFPQGVFLHSEQSGIKKSGNIIEKNGTVCLHAKKGLTHTGLTEAGFGLNSLLSMNATSLSLEKESILKALNANLIAKDTLDQFGIADIKKQLTMQASDIVLGGSMQVGDFFAQGNNLATKVTSCITTENCSLDMQEKTIMRGSLTTSESLSMKSQDITLEPTSHTSTKNGQIKATETLDNKSDLNASGILTARANYINNSGSITGQNIQINADRLWWNKATGIVSAEESLTVNALASANTLGLMQANNLTINAGIDLNLLGIYRAKNTNINALLALNAGICIPKIDSLDDLITYDNLWKAGEGLLNTFAPTAGVVYMVGNNIIGIYQKGIYHEDGFIHKGKKLAKGLQELSTDKDTGASDWIVLVCEAKNLAASAVQTASVTVDAGKAVYQGCQMAYSKIKPETVKTDAAKSAETNPNLPEVAKADTEKASEHKPINWESIGLQATSSLVSTFGPQMNRDTLVDVNCGVTAGVNNHSRNAYNTNYGVSVFANKNTVQTYTNINHGISIASDNHVSAQTYTDTGFSAAINNTIISDEANLSGKNKTLNNFVLDTKKKASIRAEIDAHNVSIHGKEVNLAQESKINSHGVKAHIAAESITSQSAINGNHVQMDANSIDLQDGSNIQTQGEDNAIDINAKERLESRSGSSMDGQNVSIETESFHGEEGNSIRGKTTIKTNNLDNKGYTHGKLKVEFGGNPNQLKSIGQVDKLHYKGTIENNLADKFAHGKNDLVNIKKSVKIKAGQQDVHFKEQHTMDHSLKAKTKGAIKCDEKLTSKKSIGLNAQKDIDHVDLDAKKKIDMAAGGSIKAASTVKRTGDSKNYEDKVKKVSVTGNKVNMRSKKNIEHKAVNVRAGKGGITMTAEGKIKSDAVISEKHSETYVVNKKKCATKTTKETSTKSDVSTYTSEGGITIKAGDTVELDGTTFHSKEKPFIDGKNGVNGYAAYEAHEYESHYKKDGGWFGKSVESHMKTGSATAKMVDFKGGQVPVITSEKKISMPFTSDSSKIVLNAPSVACKLAQNEKISSSIRNTDNLVWQTEKAPTKVDITYSPSYRIIETNAERIHIEEIKENTPLSIKRINSDAKITRQLFEEIHENQLRSSQGPTRAASLVIAMAVTMATSGIGAGVGGTVAASIGCKSATSTAIITNATATAVTSLSVQATDALLHCNGDILAAAKKIASTDTLKNIALSAATSGAMAGTGEVINQLGLPVVSEAHNLGERLAYAAPRQIANATIKTAANVAAGQKFEDAALNNLKSATAGTFGMACAGEIGDAYAKGQIDPVSHKLLHGMVGAVEGTILNGPQGALIGSASAMIAETVADLLAPKMPLPENIRAFEKDLGRSLTFEEFSHVWSHELKTYLEDVATTADISKLAAVSIALLSQKNVETAHIIASTAIDNNFVHLAMVGLIGVGVGYSAYEVYSAYQHGGPEVALKQLGIEVVTHAAGAIVGAAAGKVVFKVGEIAYPTVKAAMDAVFEVSPGLKLAIGEMADAIAVGVEKLNQSKIGKCVTQIENGLINLENKAAQKLGNITSPKYTKEKIKPLDYGHSVIQYEQLKNALQAEEFTSVINCTEHGLQRLIERKFTPNEVSSLFNSPDYLKIQSNGAKAFIKQIENNKYNFMVYNQEKGKVVMALKNINKQDLINLGKNYGWEF